MLFKLKHNQFKDILKLKAISCTLHIIKREINFLKNYWFEPKLYSALTVESYILLGFFWALWRICRNPNKFQIRAI